MVVQAELQIYTLPDCIDFCCLDGCDYIGVGGDIISSNAPASTLLAAIGQ